MFTPFFLLYLPLLFAGIGLLGLLSIGYILYLQRKILRQAQQQPVEIQNQLRSSLHEMQQNLQQFMHAGQIGIHDKIAHTHLSLQPLIVESIQRQMTDVREQIGHSFTQHSGALTQHLQAVTEEIRTHLHNLTHQVQNRLTEGFEKTSATFIDVVQRLALIDEAQKKIVSLNTYHDTLFYATKDEKKNLEINKILTIHINNLQATIELDTALSENDKFIWLRAVENVLNDFVFAYKTKTKSYKKSVLQVITSFFLFNPFYTFTNDFYVNLK
jgi:hypothetical protein